MLVASSQQALQVFVKEQKRKRALHVVERKEHRIGQIQGVAIPEPEIVIDEPVGFVGDGQLFVLATNKRWCVCVWYQWVVLYTSTDTLLTVVRRFNCGKVWPSCYFTSKERVHAIAHSVLGEAAGLERKSNGGCIQLHHLAGVWLELRVALGERLVRCFLKGWA